jgi:hypothetical protein
MGSIGYDLPTAILCLIMASSLSSLHVLSSPKHKKWFTLPGYVRLGFLASAVGMAYRGAELFTLAGPSGRAAPLGHIDPVGFVLTCSMTFTFVGLSVHAILTQLPPRVRERLERVEHLAHVKPHGPVLAELALDGFTVVEPGGVLPTDPLAPPDVKRVARRKR